MKGKKTKKIDPRDPRPGEKFPYDHERFLEVLVARGLSQSTGNKERGRLVALQKALRVNGFPDSPGPIVRVLRNESTDIPPYILVFIHEILEINISYLYRLSDEIELHSKKPRKPRELTAKEKEFMSDLEQYPDGVERAMTMKDIIYDPIRHKELLERKAQDLKP